MSAKVNYGSDIIEQLPLTGEHINPEEYARIAPFLDEGSKVVYPLRRYILLLGLFIFFSYNLIDKFLIGASPILGKHPLITIVAKSFIFIVLLYIIDNIMIDNK